MKMKISNVSRALGPNEDIGAICLIGLLNKLNKTSIELSKCRTYVEISKQDYTTLVRASAEHNRTYNITLVSMTELSSLSGLDRKTLISDFQVLERRGIQDYYIDEESDFVIAFYYYGRKSDMMSRPKDRPKRRKR